MFAGKMIDRTVKWDNFAIIFVGVALRAIVSLHSYSGAAKPPMYGDYEAQRHWQEITINLPVTEWYRNSTQNDLHYWGLDYPPLTAYHSYIMGAVGKHKDYNFVELASSRGYESSSHKSFMRLTVLFCDILIYIPGTLTLAITLANIFKRNMSRSLLFLFMVYPGQILIDNGHFQYNNVSLGFTAFAISFILKDCYCLGSFFFSLALNYKQMELYHAVPFFVYLLKVCCSEKSLFQGLRQLVAIGSTVLCTFLTLWIPWIRSFDSAANVVGRLFPINRGVFEDKVANFWCAINVVYKLKTKISHQGMALLCLSTTLAAVLPLSISLYKTTTKKNFLYCLTSAAMAFFLFSFQVHEKSILLVALPAITLFVFNPMEVIWFLEVSTFSMFPLFIKDGLTLPFFALLFIFCISANVQFRYNFTSCDKTNLYTRRLSKCIAVSTILIIAICILTIVDLSPQRYPFIWPLIIALFSCAHFILFKTVCVFLKKIIGRIKTLALYR